MEIILYGLFTLFLSIMFYSMVIKMLHENSVYKKNYRGDKVISIMGMVFIPVVSISLIFAYYYRIIDSSVIMNMLLLVHGMGFAGLLDDLIGNRNHRGIKGHIKELIKGKLTTGAVKAISGVSVSFVVALNVSDGWALTALNFCLLLLSINLINLFDIVPGRAIKGFLCLSSMMLFFVYYIPDFIVILPILVLCVICLGDDLKAKIMLGDTGANILGASLGYILVLSSHLVIKVAFLVFLVVTHIIGEYYSISTIINKYRVLRYLDWFGRLRN